MEMEKECCSCKDTFPMSKMHKSSKEQICKGCAKEIRDERRKESRKQKVARIKERNEWTAIEAAAKKQALSDSLHFKITTRQPVKVNKLLEALNKAEANRINEEMIDFIGL